MHLVYSPEYSIFHILEVLGNICLLLKEISKYQGIKPCVIKMPSVFLHQLSSLKQNDSLLYMGKK